MQFPEGLENTPFKELWKIKTHKTFPWVSKVLNLIVTSQINQKKENRQNWAK